MKHESLNTIQKILINTSQVAKNYLQELQDAYNITLDYGNIFYTYSKPLEEIFQNKDDITYFENTQYSLISKKLPKSYYVLKPRIAYNSLLKKYLIIGLDTENNLFRLEFINEESVKELLKICENCD